MKGTTLPAGFVLADPLVTHKTMLQKGRGPVGGGSEMQVMLAGQLSLTTC
jgi:hypothetical protein